MATRNTKTTARSASSAKSSSNGRSNGTAKKATATRKPAAKSSEMEQSPFHQLFMDELKDIYWAEKHLVKALPKMQKAASTAELVDAFAEHLEQTKEHVSRIEEIFELLGARPVAKKCEAMEGLVAEAQELISEEDAGSVLMQASSSPRKKWNTTKLQLTAVCVRWPPGWATAMPPTYWNKRWTKRKKQIPSSPRSQNRK